MNLKRPSLAIVKPRVLQPMLVSSNEGGCYGVNTETICTVGLLTWSEWHHCCEATEVSVLSPAAKRNLCSKYGKEDKSVRSGLRLIGILHNSESNFKIYKIYNVWGCGVCSATSGMVPECELLLIMQTIFGKKTSRRWSWPVESVSTAQKKFCSRKLSCS
jgi:hypothetical protein